MEIYFQYLKWVFCIISFRCLVYEISLFEVALVCNQRGPTPFNLGLVFLTPNDTLENLCYINGKVSLSDQKGILLNFILFPSLRDITD
jgi:hypothetical protein